MSASLEAKASRESSTPGLLSRSFAKRKALPTGLRLDGQTAIVTGSNAGLGLEASRQLLKLGVSTLIMGVRSQAKGEAAAKQLRSEFPGTIVSVWILDMESYDSVRQFAQNTADLPRLDIVILNAALVKVTYTPLPETEHEMNLQINYLSTALLAILLLPILKSKKVPGASRPPVLSIVGSDTMYTTDYWPRLQGPTFKQYDEAERFDYMPWYGGCKLMLAFFVSQLAEQIDPSDVLINVPNPGPTRNTGLAREAPRAVKIALMIAQFLLGRTMEQAASIYLEAALVLGSESHGSFVSEWIIKPSALNPAPYYTILTERRYPSCWYTTEGQDFRRRLWEETLEELRLLSKT
jgi:NAD(P)-dependent dehydrogenase (short-subunit alcohol dehydrogenase family)